MIAVVATLTPTLCRAEWHVRSNRVLPKSPVSPCHFNVGISSPLHRRNVAVKNTCNLPQY